MLDHVLHQLVEIVAEQVVQQRPRCVHALIHVRIAIILAKHVSPDAGTNQPVRHVSQEIQALLFTAAMREQVVLQNFHRKIALLSCTRLFVHVDRGVHHVARDYFERLFLREHRVGINDGPLQRLQHRRIGALQIQQNDFAHSAVRGYAERSKQRKQCNGLLDARNLHINREPEPVVFVRNHHVDLLGGDALEVGDGLDFCHPVPLGVPLGHVETVHAVLGRALLSQHRLLAAVHDEVAARVVLALSGHLMAHVLALLQHANIGLQHDRQLADRDFRQHFVVVLHVVQLCARANDDLDFHIHRHGRRVREIPQSGLLRKHQFRGAVVLVDLRAVQIEVLEFHHDFKTVFFEHTVVVLLRENVHRVEHLYRAFNLIAHKIIVRFQLVPHQPLQMPVFKIGTHHVPRLLHILTDGSSYFVLKLLRCG